MGLPVGHGSPIEDNSKRSLSFQVTRAGSLHIHSGSWLKAMLVGGSIQGETGARQVGRIQISRSLKAIRTQIDTPKLVKSLGSHPPGLCEIVRSEVALTSAKPIAISRRDEVPQELCCGNSRSLTRDRAHAKRRLDLDRTQSRAGTRLRPARRRLAKCLTSKARTIGSREDSATEVTMSSPSLSHDRRSSSDRTQSRAKTRPGRLARRRIEE